ncbi:MAG: hypothetical protein DWQ04_10705 [Chloroflexi bacterium]|nr:MAG: hypothetical protein DWQ04_10705 [Chloroflexota bacterium]
MKTIYLLIVAALLLVGCGLNEASQNTTASIGTGNEKGDGEETAVLPTGETILTALKDIQCEGMTIPNSSQVQITYRVELAEDGLKMGGSGPYYLYGGGILQAEGNKNSFDGAVQFECSGVEKTAVMHLQKSKQEEAHKLLVENLNLTAQIDGVTTSLSDTSIRGLANMEAQNPDFLLEEEGIYFLANFQCQGRMIPNSSTASIIFTGETKDGQQFFGGGNLDTGLDLKSTNNFSKFQCSLKGNGRVHMLTATEDKSGATLTNLALEGLELRSANGQSFLIEIASVCGFNIGMPPS